VASAGGSRFVPTLQEPLARCYRRRFADQDECDHAAFW